MNVGPFWCGPKGSGNPEVVLPFPSQHSLGHDPVRGGTEYSTGWDQRRILLMTRHPCSEATFPVYTPPTPSRNEPSTSLSASWRRQQDPPPETDLRVTHTTR